MKGAEQLARSCRRLGREGVGARRAGTRTRTRAARAPRHKPRGAAPLRSSPRSAPLPGCRTGSAERRAPADWEGGLTAPLASLPSGFLGVGFVFCRVLLLSFLFSFFGGARTPFLGRAARGPPPLPGFFASFIWGCAWRLLLLVLLIAPGPFLALCGSAV